MTVIARGQAEGRGYVRVASRAGSPLAALPGKCVGGVAACVSRLYNAPASTQARADPQGRPGTDRENRMSIIIDRREFARIWNEERTQRWPMMVTFIATITLSLEWAILLGITVALITQRFNRS